MVTYARQIVGVSLAAIGFLGTIIICVLPSWKVTAFIGNNIITVQIVMEGLWMNCVTQSNGQRECKVYESISALPKDLQAARALVVLSIIVGVVGIALGVVGGKCTNFVAEEKKKSKVAIAGGVVVILAGLLVLIPVSWVGHEIIPNFYKPAQNISIKKELGSSLFIGWVSAGLLFLGGAILCSTCPPKDVSKVKYSTAHSVESKAYV